MKVLGKQLQSMSHETSISRNSNSNNINNNRSGLNAILMKKRKRLLSIVMVGMVILMFQDTLNWTNRINDNYIGANEDNDVNGENVNAIDNGGTSSHILGNRQTIMNHSTRISTIYNSNNNNQQETSDASNGK
jgi:hypothetical protein